MKRTITAVLFILILKFVSYSQELNLKFEKAPKFRFEPFETAIHGIRLTEEEFLLYRMITLYREENGLAAVPLSVSLTFVAQTHARDLRFNVKENNRCNLHSWSKKGPWSHCCYRPDHRKAACMWAKPRELTSYAGDGFEIAYFHSWDPTAEDAFRHWKNSPLHNPVLLNLDNWKKIPWKAMGIGIYEEYAVVWFGRETDPEGPPLFPE